MIVGETGAAGDKVSCGFRPWGAPRRGRQRFGGFADRRRRLLPARSLRSRRLGRGCSDVGRTAANRRRLLPGRRFRGRRASRLNGRKRSRCRRWLLGGLGGQERNDLPNGARGVLLFRRRWQRLGSCGVGCRWLGRFFAHLKNFTANCIRAAHPLAAHVRIQLKTTAAAGTIDSDMHRSVPRRWAPVDAGFHSKRHGKAWEQKIAPPADAI